jgi:hypothetical protein
MSLDQVLKLMKSRDIVGGSDLCAGYVILGAVEKVKTATDVRERQVLDAAGWASLHLLRLLRPRRPPTGAPSQRPAQRWPVPHHQGRLHKPCVRDHRAAAVPRRRARLALPRRPAHPAHDTRGLVAGDLLPIALGGDPHQQIVVICRSANSSKGARRARPGRR